MLTRRRALGMAAALILPRTARAARTFEIGMWGNPSGSRVSFDPVGLRLLPGDSVRWTNGDAGNSHTATAYHPASFGRPRRMPATAKPWDSGYLLPGESFAATLTIEGVYDYYCLPHEHAGMVGRLVVGDPGADGWLDQPGAAGDLPQIALDAFPPVAEIMDRGLVQRA
jgi:plastocyanin